jgi:hypothetical protein
MRKECAAAPRSLQPAKRQYAEVLGASTRTLAPTTTSADVTVLPSIVTATGLFTARVLRSGSAR